MHSCRRTAWPKSVSRSASRSANAASASTYVDRNDCVKHRHARPVSKLNRKSAPVRAFVDCGAPLPGIQVEVRDADGNVLPEREIGTLWVRTDSVMQGYLHQPEATAEVLTPDGWLDTGDLGYLLDGRIFVTGREKDMIIVGGRNFWPQDLEYVAESQETVRTGDSMAFSISDESGERVVLLIQSRELDPRRVFAWLTRCTRTSRPSSAFTATSSWSTRTHCRARRPASRRVRRRVACTPRRSRMRWHRAPRAAPVPDAA